MKIRKTHLLALTLALVCCWNATSFAGYRGGINVYEYVESKPIGNVDPLGTVRVETIGNSPKYTFCEFSDAPQTIYASIAMIPSEQEFKALENTSDALFVQHRTEDVRIYDCDDNSPVQSDYSATTMYEQVIPGRRSHSYGSMQEYELPSLRPMGEPEFGFYSELINNWGGKDFCCTKGRIVVKSNYTLMGGIQDELNFDVRAIPSNISPQEGSQYQGYRLGHLNFNANTTIFSLTVYIAISWGCDEAPRAGIYSSAPLNRNPNMSRSGRGSDLLIPSWPMPTDIYNSSR